MSKRRPAVVIPSLPLAAAPPASTPELADFVMHEEPATSRPLASIRPHPAPSRALDPRHVLDMARSIAALGLIHPLAVDLDDVVLAGSHRLAALRVLAASPDERADLLYALCSGSPAATLDALAPTVASLPHPVPAVTFSAIPVRIMPLRLSDDAEGRGGWRSRRTSGAATTRRARSRPSHSGCGRRGTGWRAAGLGRNCAPCPS